MMDAVRLSSLFGPYLHMNNSNSHIRDKEIIKGLLLLFYPSCNNIIKHFIYHILNSFLSCLQGSLGMMCDLLHSGGLFGGDFTAMEFSTVTFSAPGIFSTFWKSFDFLKCYYLLNCMRVFLFL